MSENKNDTNVLVVDDEEGLTDLYATWLKQEGYNVHTAYDGKEAIDLIENIGEELHAVLLDRRMPQYTGDEVLEELRDMGVDCGVAMVTAVEPDYDIVEMGFDTYVQKPVAEADVIGTVEKLLRTNDYDSKVQELLSLLSKKKSLEQEKSGAVLSKDETYKDLEDKIYNLRQDLSEEVHGDAIVDLLYNLTGEHLLVSLQYTPEEWEFRYIDRQVESFFLTLEEENKVGNLIQIFRSQQQSHAELNEIISSDEHYVTLQLFEKFVYIHFYHENGNGIMFGFDIDSVSNLTNFVAEVIPYLEQTEYFSTRVNEPNW